MPIHFTCPHCGNCSLVDDRYAGRSGPCASCHMQVVVPSLQEARTEGLYREEINPPNPDRGSSDSEWPPMWIIAGIFLAILVLPAMLFFLFVMLPFLRMGPIMPSPPAVTAPPPSATVTVVASPATTGPALPTPGAAPPGKPRP